MTGPDPSIDMVRRLAGRGGAATGDELKAVLERVIACTESTRPAAERANEWDMAIRAVREAHARLSDRGQAEPPAYSDSERTTTAAAIMDVWMGGNQAWRTDMDKSLILESADWEQALKLADAALAARSVPVGGESVAARLLAEYAQANGYDRFTWKGRVQTQGEEAERFAVDVSLWPASRSTPATPNPPPVVRQGSTTLTPVTEPGWPDVPQATGDAEEHDDAYGGARQGIEGEPTPMQKLMAQRSGHEVGCNCSYCSDPDGSKAEAAVARQGIGEPALREAQGQIDEPLRNVVRNIVRKALSTTPTPVVPEGVNSDAVRRAVKDALAQYHAECAEFVKHPGPAADALITKLRSLLATDKPAIGQEGGGRFQARVGEWMLACFGPEISADGMERNHRFLEESLELVQSLGCTASEAHQLVDYVFGRHVGDPQQEVGGVRVTLAALCNAHSIGEDEAAERELARIWTKVEQIRAKQAAKPKHSPLPATPTQEGPDA